MSPRDRGAGTGAQVDEMADETPDLTSPRPRSRAASLVRRGVGVLAVGLLVWYLVDQWHTVSPSLERMTVGSLVVAGVAVLVALLFNLLSWREILAGLGSELPFREAARVYIFAQIGKYVPGSVWPVLAQIELARDYHVPRRRSAAAALVALVLGVGVGFGVAAVTLAASGVHVIRRYAWVAAIVPVIVVALHPAVLQRSLNLLARVLRREPSDERLRGSSLARSVGWSIAMWIAFGVQVLALAHDLTGASMLRLFLVGTGAYAAAWVIGFLVILAPAGAGAREAVLVVVLVTVLPRPDAIAIALVSRLLSVLGDALWVGAVGLLFRRRVS